MWRNLVSCRAVRPSDSPPSPSCQTSKPIGVEWRGQNMRFASTLTLCCWIVVMSVKVTVQDNLPCLSICLMMKIVYRQNLNEHWLMLRPSTRTQDIQKSCTSKSKKLCCSLFTTPQAIVPSVHPLPTSWTMSGQSSQTRDLHTSRVRPRSKLTVCSIFTTLRATISSRPSSSHVVHRIPLPPRVSLHPPITYRSLN